MSSIDIFKHLFNVLGSAVNKSQQHPEKFFWGTPRIEPGAALVRSKYTASVLYRPPFRLKSMVKLFLARTVCQVTGDWCTIGDTLPGMGPSITQPPLEK